MDIRVFLPGERLAQPSRTVVKCPRCHKEFPGKYKLQRHLDRKNRCKIIHVKDEEPNEKATICLYCRRSFEELQSSQIRSHIYYCRKKHGGVEHVDEEQGMSMVERIERLEAAVNEMKETIIQLSSIIRQ